MRASYALSVQQPWAWLIVNGHKDVENRRWSTDFRGAVLIHAGKKVDAEAISALRCGRNPAHPSEPLPTGIILPEADWQTGGIVGVVNIVGCVDRSTSEWFVGPHGFLLRNGTPLPFAPCRGQLGFWVPPLEVRRQALGEAA